MAPTGAGKRMIIVNGQDDDEAMLKAPPPLQMSDEPRMVDVEKPLFVFEVYIHSVEGLSRKLQNKLPSFAVQLLDFAPVIIAPTNTHPITNKQGAVWYGSGKRCLFEEDEMALGMALKARGPTALLVLEIENNEATSKRKLYGSATVALDHFGQPSSDLEPCSGAVHTWGRIETRVIVKNPRGKEAGIVTLSASLSSLDNSLRPVLAQQVTSSRDSCHLNNIRESADSSGHPCTSKADDEDEENATSRAGGDDQSPVDKTRKSHDQARPSLEESRQLSGEGHVLTAAVVAAQEKADNDEHDRQLLAVSVALSQTSASPSSSLPKKFVARPDAISTNSYQRPPTPPASTRPVRRHTYGQRPGTAISNESIPSTEDPFSSSSERCVNATLRMPDLTTLDFDANRQSMLIDAIAGRAEVPNHHTEILAWREGSLIVDIRVHFLESEARKASRFTEKLTTATSSLLPKHIFGPCELLEYGCKLGSPALNTHSSYNNLTTLRVPRPPTVPSPNNRITPSPLTLNSPNKQHIQNFYIPTPPGTVSRRSLDTLRANSSQYEEQLGDCPPPLYHAATSYEAERRSSRGDFPVQESNIIACTGSAPRVSHDTQVQRTNENDSFNESSMHSLQNDDTISSSRMSLTSAFGENERESLCGTRDSFNNRRYSMDATPSTTQGNNFTTMHRSTFDSRSSRGSYNTGSTSNHSERRASAQPKRLVRTRSHRSGNEAPIPVDRGRRNESTAYDTFSEDASPTPLDDSPADQLQVISDSILAPNTAANNAPERAPQHSPALEYQLNHIFSQIQGQDGKVSIREMRACVPPGSIADEFLVLVRNHRPRLNFDELIQLAESTPIPS